jgi:hypothetical protein
MLKQASSPESKKDIKTRQHLMERSFARGTRYGYQRARWRAISLDFVALWRSLCFAILLRSPAERKSNQIQKNKKYSPKFALTKYRFRQQPVKI